MGNKILNMLWRLKSGVKMTTQIVLPTTTHLGGTYENLQLVNAENKAFPFEKRLERIISDPTLKLHYCTSGVVSNLGDAPTDDILFQNSQTLQKFLHLNSDFIFCDTIAFYRDNHFQINIDELVRGDENLYLSFVARGEKLI